MQLTTATSLLHQSNIRCWPALSAITPLIQASERAMCVPIHKIIMKWGGPRNCTPESALSLTHIYTPVTTASKITRSAFRGFLCRSTFMPRGQRARRIDLEFDVTNVSNSISQIAKESEEIPIQYAPSRTVGGSLKFHF